MFLSKNGGMVLMRVIGVLSFNRDALRFSDLRLLATRGFYFSIKGLGLI